MADHALMRTFFCIGDHPDSWPLRLIMDHVLDRVDTKWGSVQAL